MGNPTQQQSSLILTLKENKSLLDKNKKNCCTLIEEFIFVKREDRFFSLAAMQSQAHHFAQVGQMKDRKCGSF